MGGDQDNKHDQKLQAVLLADSFVCTFQPITLHKSSPKVLSPLNNVRLLDYSIEFLAGAGVEELYVFCVNGGEAVEAYLENSTWTSSIKVKCVKDSSVTNAGDALRELDKRNIIQSDPFILMSGDVVTNVDIVPALEQHKIRHKKDSSAIMTVLLKEVGGWSVSKDRDGNTSYKASSLRSLNEDLIVGLNTANPAGNRILCYDSNPDKPGSTVIPTSFFAANAQIELRNDMLDTGIYICSPDVLARFSDEFDFLEISKFISNSVAEEEEGLQSKIYASILKSKEYAARIHDPRTYQAVSKDLLKRWCYPIVPDNLPSGYDKKYRYEMLRHMIYVEQKGKVKIGRGAVLKGPGMVGSKSKIEHECIIARTVIGNNCEIGKNVSISDSHLWESVIVEDNVTISESILCDGCIIKSGATVPKGCIIGQGCVIGENITLPEFSRITICQDAQDDDFDDFDDDDGFSSSDDSSSSSSGSSSSGSSESSLDGEAESSTQQNEGGPVATGEDVVGNDEKIKRDSVPTDHGVVGIDGLGRVWTPTYENFGVMGGDDSDFDSDDEEEIAKRTSELVRTQSIGYDPTTLLHKRMQRQLEEDDLSESEYKMEDDDDSDTYGNDYENASDFSDDGDVHITGRQKGVDVVNEMKSFCMEHDESQSFDNLRMELTSFKFSQNAEFGDCVTGAVLAVFERLNITSDISATKLVSSFKNKLGIWGGMLESLCKGVEEEKSIILATERAATGEGVIGEVLSREPSFRFILQTLHGEEYISDEAITAWATMRREENNSDSPRVKLFQQKSTQQFLEWIEAEDDSDSDSSGSGSDSDSDSD